MDFDTYPILNFIINPITLGVILWILISYPLHIIASKIRVSHAWMAWFPIMNTLLLLRMAQKPLWWILLLFIPILNLIVGIRTVHQGISIRTGHGHGMTIMILLLPFIFLPIVAHTFHPADTMVDSYL